MADMLRGARRFLSRLKPVKAPDAPARNFRDLWPGDPQRGARLLRGELEVAGTTRPFASWDFGQGPLPWRAAAHGFVWLRDLRSLGTDAARVRARDLAEDWLTRGANDPLASAPEVRRLRSWMRDEIRDQIRHARPPQSYDEWRAGAAGA